MTDDSRNLVETADESSVNLVNRVPRYSMSCNRGSMVTGLSVFVALLLAGQAITVYFLVQHQDKLAKIDYTTKELKMENMLKKLPGSPPSASKPKMSMASIDIPLMVRDANQPIPLSRAELKKIAESSNKVGDAVHYVLRSGRPLKTFPTFNDTIIENLKELRKSLSDEEWVFFNSWLQQWFLLYLVQNPKTTKEATLLRSAFPTETPVLTLCQLQATGQSKPGHFKPLCDENGDFETMQCWRSTGYCWCVAKNGTEIPETRSRDRASCNDIFMQDEFNTGSAVQIEEID